MLTANDYRRIFAGRKDKTAQPVGAKIAAVTVLFVVDVPLMHHENKESGDGILLIRRSSRMNHHSGEWAFPGGSIETSDNSLLAGALRETEEEIAAMSKQITIWGELDKVYTPSGYAVSPFVGALDETAHLQADPNEVAEISFLPVHALLATSHWRSLVFAEGNALRRTLAYTHGGKFIWGATARILKQVASLL